MSSSLATQKDGGSRPTQAKLWEFPSQPVAGYISTNLSTQATQEAEIWKIVVQVSLGIK
jgi:hypothetical protein